LKGESLQILHDSIAVLKEKIQQLSSGEIMVKDLKLIVDKKEHFQKILTVMKDVDAPKMMRILAIREKELQAYTKTFQTVQTFLFYCIYCKGKVGDN
jgi:ATP-dependent RNA circularization protein (DNA/RNA ligase family)